MSGNMAMDRAAYLPRYTKLCVNLIFELSEGTSREGKLVRRRNENSSRTYLSNETNPSALMIVVSADGGERKGESGGKLYCGLAARHAAQLPRMATYLYYQLLRIALRSMLIHPPKAIHCFQSRHCCYAF